MGPPTQDGHTSEGFVTQAAAKPPESRRESPREGTVTQQRPAWEDSSESVSPPDLVWQLLSLAEDRDQGVDKKSGELYQSCT